MKFLQTLIVVSIALSLTLGCGRGNQEQYMQARSGEGGSGAQDWKKPERPKFKIPVTVQRLERGRMYSYLQAVGTVVPIRELELKPEITGRIFYTKRWKEGDEVKKDDILASMDDRDLRLNVNEAELQLQISSAAIKPASAQLMQSYKDEEFKLKMYERGAISKAEYDQAVLARIQQENRYEETVSNVQSREMSLTKMKQELEKVEIVFPFDGILLPAQQSVATNLNEGFETDLTLLQGQTVGANSVLCRIANIEEVYVALDVPAKDVEMIKSGQDVELEIFTRSGKDYRGNVTEISTAMNSGTRTFTVNVLVKNPARDLRPGMFAKARIITDEKPDAISIPREIVQIRNNREIVFVAKEKPVEEKPNIPAGENGSQQPLPESKDSPSTVSQSSGSEKLAYAADSPNTDNSKKDENGGIGEPPFTQNEENESAVVQEEISMIVEEREIVRGIENRERVEIVEGLKAGDLLVILGYETLSNEVDVNVTIREDLLGDSVSSIQ